MQVHLTAAYDKLFEWLVITLWPVAEWTLREAVEEAIRERENEFRKTH